MAYFKVEGEPTLVKDSVSKGILSVDVRGLSEYKRLREKHRAEKNLIMQCETDINTLKTELNDIKNSLNLILNRLNTR